MRRIFTLSLALVCLSATINKSFAQTPSLTLLTNSQCGTVNFTNTYNETFTSGTNSLAGFSGAPFTKVISGNSEYLNADVQKSSSYQLSTPYFQNPATTTNLKFDIGGTANITAYTISYVTQGNSSPIQIGNQITTTGSSSIVGTQCLEISNLNTMVNSGTLFAFVITFYTNTQSNGTGNITFDNFYLRGTTGQAVLPVHFSSVSVRKASEGALLTWNVGTEQNVSGYDVEKSVDGRSFTKIGFVTASNLSAYNFTDAKAGVVNFYRVKSVDIDGKFGYSTVVSLNNGAASVVVKAFMSDKSTLTVQHDAAQSGSRISVISMDGRVVKVQQPATGAQQTKVDLSAAQTGLYIIRYDNGQGGSESIKIVK